MLGQRQEIPVTWTLSRGGWYLNGMLMLTNGFFFFTFVEPRRAPASKNAQNGMKYKVGADFLSSTECLSVTVVSDDYTL